MNQFEKDKELYEAIREISKKHKIGFITAKQPPRPEGYLSFSVPKRRSGGTFGEVMIIDYQDMLIK